MPRYYATRCEAVQREIIAPLEAGDVKDIYAQFDMDELILELVEYAPIGPNGQWLYFVPDEPNYFLSVVAAHTK